MKRRPVIDSRALEMARRAAEFMGSAALAMPDAAGRLMISFGISRKDATAIINAETMRRGGK